MYILIFLLFHGSFSQETLQNPKCNHWMDPGTCEQADRQQFNVQWYYDRYDHRCRKFFYGGCGGNENRFNSLEECSSHCQYHESTAYERCAQPHDPGTCQSDIERWFFDMNKKQCVCSWWTGCGGNSNRYYSYNHCMEICGEYAEHGPGIDENYWGKLNGSSMSLESQSVFDNYAPLPHPQPQNPQNSREQYQYQSHEYQPRSPFSSGEQYQQPMAQPPQSPLAHTFSHPPSDQTDRSGEFRTAAISWAEFHGYGSNENGLAELKKGDEEFHPKQDAKAFGQRIHRQRISFNPNEMAGKQYTVIQANGFPNVTIGMNRMEQKRQRFQNMYRNFPNAPYYAGGAGAQSGNRQPATQVRPTPFYKTYFTDSRGNQIFPENRTQENHMADSRTIVKTYEQKIPTRTLVPMEELSKPPKTQIMASYNSDQWGRRLDSKKVTWTGYGAIPIDSLPHDYRQWAHEFMQKINNGQFYTANQQSPQRQPWRQPQTPAQPPVRRPVPAMQAPTYPPTAPPTMASVPVPTRPVPRPTVPPTLPPTYRPQTTTTQRPTEPPTQYAPRPTVAPQTPPTVPPTQRPTHPPRIQPSYPAPTARARAPPTVAPTLTATYPPTVPPTVYYPTYRPTVHEIYVARVQDATTQRPTMRVPAQPIEYYKPQIEKLTPATLSIEDIIALDSHSDYEEYDQPLDEPQPNEQRMPAVTTVPPPRVIATTRRPAERRQPETKQPGWNAIVMPPDEGKKKSAENDFDFEIESYGDAI